MLHHFKIKGAFFVFIFYNIFKKKQPFFKTPSFMLYRTSENLQLNDCLKHYNKSLPFIMSVSDKLLNVSWCFLWCQHFVIISDLLFRIFSRVVCNFVFFPLGKHTSFRLCCVQLFYNRIYSVTNIKKKVLNARKTLFVLQL